MHNQWEWVFHNDSTISWLRPADDSRGGHRDVDYLQIGPAGGIQQPRGLAEDIILSHHLGEAGVLERPVLVHDVVYKIHDQQRGKGCCLI